MSFSTAHMAPWSRPLRVRSYDAVVPAHGAAFDKTSWASFASWLAGRGHQVLAIDFRYGGAAGW